MFFSVSNNGTQWTLDFSPDSVTIIVKDMVKDLTISSLELPIAAFNSLINQRQQFLDNHLARVPITPNQQGTWEMQDEVRASVGDHDVISDFVPSDLDDIQFHWENPNIDMDAVYRPGIDTPFSPSLFENIPVAGSADYPIEIDDEQDKENEYPTTPESQRPLQPPPPLHRSLSRPFGTRLENIPNSVYRSLFE